MIKLDKVLMSIIFVFLLIGCTNNTLKSVPISSISTDSITTSSDIINSTTNYENYVFNNRSYKSIPKKSYSGNTYSVQRGDTLFYIAWITGNGYRDLAKINNIHAPYALNIGQKIQLYKNSTSKNNNTLTGRRTYTAKQGMPRLLTSRHQIQAIAVQSRLNDVHCYTTNKKHISSLLDQHMRSSVITQVEHPSATNTLPVKHWRWPTIGKIINNFSSEEGGNKGIDITGLRGQPIYATADGRVVYSGNALRGYGNLVIIKHNNDYLSAYAHNDTMLVREQQAVKAGQKVACMGSTGTSSVRLHFEIRYKGKSVNPLCYLPQR
ncbi:murein hydrolase activator NlpD [Candidatus Gillettellia adelgis]